MNVKKDSASLLEQSWREHYRETYNEWVRAYNSFVKAQAAEQMALRKLREFTVKYDAEAQSFTEAEWRQHIEQASKSMVVESSKVAEARRKLEEAIAEEKAQRDKRNKKCS